jgi:hypothetical protein
MSSLNPSPCVSSAPARRHADDRNWGSFAHNENFRNVNDLSGGGRLRRIRPQLPEAWRQTGLST